MRGAYRADAQPYLVSQRRGRLRQHGEILVVAVRGKLHPVSTTTVLQEFQQAAHKIAEIIKLQSHKGHHGQKAYYWRDNNRVEIDSILEGADGKLHLIEIKGGATINTDYMKNLTSFPVRGLGVEKHVIYTGDKSLTIGDVEITGWNGLIKLLAQLSEK